METINIKCPKDGSVLKVPKVNGLETKYITCPICKERRLFSEYKVIEEKADETQMAGETTPIHKTNGGPGKITVEETGETIKLKEGKNIIGRRSPGSNADIQLTSPSNRMSREHIIIDVSRDKQGTFRHKVKLYKSKVNPTYVGNMRLEEEDVILLAEGTKIKLPDATLIFRMEKEDDTI